jgi:TRAP-type C4-dicarboxylate transport system permease small subunit
MRGVLERVERALDFAGSACLGLLATAVFAQVVLRYAFSVSPVWSEEVCRILLVWGIVCGAVVSVRRNQHIRVEFIVEKFPPRLRRVWFLLIDIATLVFFAAVAVAGVDAVRFNHSIRSVALQWPLSYLLAAIPAGFAVAAVFLGARLGRREERTEP